VRKLLPLLLKGRLVVAAAKAEVVLCVQPDVRFV